MTNRCEMLPRLGGRPCVTNWCTAISLRERAVATGADSNIYRAYCFKTPSRSSRLTAGPTIIAHKATSASSRRLRASLCPYFGRHQRVCERARGFVQRCSWISFQLRRKKRVSLLKAICCVLWYQRWHKQYSRLVFVPLLVQYCLLAYPIGSCINSQGCVD